MDPGIEKTTKELSIKEQIGYYIAHNFPMLQISAYSERIQIVRNLERKIFFLYTMTLPDSFLYGKF